AADDQSLNWAFALAKRSIRTADEGLLPVVRGWLTDPPCRMKPGRERAERLRAMTRFEQLSSPVAAKSVEDTAFYRYGRLLSRNEVGSTPAQFAVSPPAFHAAASSRQANFPHAMLATATHDHKRGEDTRVRLAVLSEIPEEWAAALLRWMRLDASLVRDLDSGRAPSAADEIMLYEMLVSAWPIGLDPNDAEGTGAFSERIFSWWQKSIREAKLRSGWAAPDEAYEAACQGFLSGVLDASRAARVGAEIAAFAARIGPAGAVNSLSQVMLKYTVPGVPDLYQGTEFWDQSLVDPDNRRPVDFTAREKALAQGKPPEELLESWQSGAVKQALIARLLAMRAEMPELFGKGGYSPLAAEGAKSRNILAFSRSHEDRQIIVAVTRLPASLLGDSPIPLAPAAAWENTRLRLQESGAAWRDALTGRSVKPGETIDASGLFASLPVALLVAN
ncbi:MAG TPA: malto-oligosyltrehalose synthase, partial [Acetobacteraceae bacterium]|nr:malto-oligosyltrehalose synthase [Acetobacteraceae bacterium]